MRSPFESQPPILRALLIALLYGLRDNISIGLTDTLTLSRNEKGFSIQHRSTRLSDRNVEATALILEGILQTEGEWDSYRMNLLCGICGNKGVFDTRGTTSPAGAAVGDVFFCICPNGRALNKSLKCETRHVPESEYWRLTDRAGRFT